MNEKSWTARPLSWRDQRRRVSELWLGRHCVPVAWMGLILAVISPPQGFEIPLCWFKSATGMPCPGCGMTRSLSCGIRGMFAESLEYHPMGLLILALFLVLAAQSLLPAGYRERVRDFVQSRARLFYGLYVAFVIAFVGLGLARAVLHHFTR